MVEYYHPRTFGPNANANTIQVQPTDNDDDSKNNLRPNIAEQFQLLWDFRHANTSRSLDWERIQIFKRGVIISIEPWELVWRMAAPRPPSHSSLSDRYS
jgi:hypothetical protein